jgi:uncharacterized protein (TIGR04255 family)
VVETSLGIQFEGLDGYRSLSAAGYWERIRDRYPNLEEHPPLDPRFETFGPSNGQLGQPQFQLIQGAIQPRYLFLSNAGDEIVQLQADRLFFNWRKRSATHVYPRHSYVRGILKERLDDLWQWSEHLGLGEVHPTQCEAIYVNRIPLKDGGGAHCQLSYIFPWLKGLMGTATTEGGTFRTRRRLLGETGQPVARLHLTLRYGTDADGDREALLHLHVRGQPLSPTMDGCLDMIDAQRAIIVRTFAEITSAEAHAIWERTQ